jgi:uncharacterized membrane protein YccC
MKNFSLSGNALLYVSRIVAGCVLVWYLLSYLQISKKEWALITVIIVSEPDFANLRANTFTRVVNTLNGSLVGLVFITLAGMNFPSLLGAITVSVLISTSFKQYPSSWKLAPATVAIVMVPSLLEKLSWREAITIALTRTGEVLIGCLVALALGLLFSLTQKSKRKGG